MIVQHHLGGRYYVRLKTKKCILCEKPAFSKGYCQQHTPKKSIKQNREKTVEKKSSKKATRDVYFEYHISRCTHSELSGKPINNPTRANICHILDKSRHPSVQDNVVNCVHLDITEHSRFDELLFKLDFETLEKEFENIWEKVCIRVKYLLPLCTENTVLTRAFEKYLYEK